MKCDYCKKEIQLYQYGSLRLAYLRLQVGLVMNDETITKETHVNIGNEDFLNFCMLECFDTWILHMIARKQTEN